VNKTAGSIDNFKVSSPDLHADFRPYAVCADRNRIAFDVINCPGHADAELCQALYTCWLWTTAPSVSIPPCFFATSSSAVIARRTPKQNPVPAAFSILMFLNFIFQYKIRDIQAVINPYVLHDDLRSFLPGEFTIIYRQLKRFSELTVI